jgi:hypothetical protein
VLLDAIILVASYFFSELGIHHSILTWGISDEKSTVSLMGFLIFPLVSVFLLQKKIFFCLLLLTV